LSLSFLTTESQVQKNRKDFFVGRVEKDVAPPCLSGEELHDVVSEYGDIVFGLQSGKQKFPGFGLTHNWVKRSIFWELLYWKTNLLRHNLDVIHIEKNMFENIFNTVMDVKGKTKDNIKARLDIALFCNHKKYGVSLCWVMGLKTKSKLRVREKSTTTSLQMA
jgi:hypothetical protein